MKYFVTYHAIERLKERFPIFCNKFPELKEWSKEKGTESVKKIFDGLVLKADENRSYLNNSVYMLKLYEKYGYDAEYCFLESKNENILLVLTKSRSEMHYRLVTVMPTEFRPSVKNVKYNDKETKNNKHQKFIMNWYDKLESKDRQLLKNVAPVTKDLVCCPEIKNQLIELVCSNKTQILSRISNAKCMHKVILNDMEYEFIYSKNSSGNKDVSLQKIRELTYEEKKAILLDFYLTPVLKKDLLHLVYNNLTEMQKISNSREIHTAEWQGLKYNFLFIKTSTGDRKITLQEEPIALNNKNKMKF